MMEEELIKIWQSSPGQERIKFEKSRLIIELQSSMDHFHRMVKNRDLLELLAVIIIVPAFSFAAYYVPYWLTKVASVLVVGWAIYITYRLRNAKKNRPAALTDTYLAYLYKTRTYLEIQKQLLESVLYWYIMPAVSLTVLFVAGFGIIAKTVKMGVVNVFLGAAVYWMNKRAVRNELLPRIAKIDKLIRVLEES